MQDDSLDTVGANPFSLTDNRWTDDLHLLDQGGRNARRGLLRMQYLSRLSDSDRAAYYTIEGDHESCVRRYIVSTQETRDICNRPEICGVEYTNRLCRAVTKALACAPFRTTIEEHPQHQVCVLNFLRGGLNFDLRRALYDAYGLNRQASAFMSSQRSRRQDGRWQVQEDMYRKLEIPSGAIILVGDVVATGITVHNGLQVLVEHLCSIGSSIRWLYFFTIGCHKLDKILTLFDEKFRSAFTDYQGTCAIYFEGKFKLVDSKTDLRIGIPGTDLIRRDALLAPEFEASQWERISYPLERCTIYDAGARAFHVPGYLEDVGEYWRQVETLARQGLTLYDAVQERWPHDRDLCYPAFREQKQAHWRNVSDRFIREHYERYLERWPSCREVEWDTAEALAEVCVERLEALRLDQASGSQSPAGDTHPAHSAEPTP